MLSSLLCDDPSDFDDSGPPEEDPLPQAASMQISIASVNKILSFFILLFSFCFYWMMADRKIFVSLFP